MKDAQKLSTKIFIGASSLFGVAGIILVLATGINDNPAPILLKTVFCLGFIVLASFGVSVGLKFLTKN